MPHTDVLSQISIAIVAATLAAILARLLKQPIILGYIAAGLLVGPTEGFGLISMDSVQPIAELGLILLLFMIGLEIDLRKLLEAGRMLVSAGVGQFVICLALGLGFWSLLGFSARGPDYSGLYLAVACALSSTMIVVKLLYDKFELDTTAGRLSLGILVFQDLWAILFLAFQKDLADPRVSILLVSLGKGVLLLVASFVISRFVLPSVFRSIAKVPELMVIGALGWCFGVAMFAAWLGLSREMGALVAGIALSTFPYSLDVIAKIISLRDFFITLFFVTLGARIPRPTVEVVLIALLGSGFVIVSRFLSVAPILHLTRAGSRASVITSLNLGQISEFSLVICTLGLALGHIDERALSIVVIMLIITAVVSTYAIQYNYQLYNWLVHPVIKRTGMTELPHQSLSGHHEMPSEVVFLGFARTTSSLLHDMLQMNPGIAERVGVVDFNPVVKEELDRRGIRSTYGDISHPDSLHHIGIHHAKVLVSTVQDSLLKGTSNLRMIQQLRAMAPAARIIVTAEQFELAREMYRDGASYVFVPRLMSPRDLARVVLVSLTRDPEDERRVANFELETRVEVLP